MSKASEWAKFCEGFAMGNGIDFVANKAAGLNLVISGLRTETYTPQEALALAAWIQDTFGEEKAGGGGE